MEASRADLNWSKRLAARSGYSSAGPRESVVRRLQTMSAWWLAGIDCRAYRGTPPIARQIRLPIFVRWEGCLNMNLGEIVRLVR